MDSLTQIVLGAACGEAVLGKKIGDKALLFGAIGGTIPDLDVLVGNLLYGNKIDAMLFHRGFMHSILFSVLASFLLGWLTFKLYNSGSRLHTTTRKKWIGLWFLSLFTHPILDCFTPYGTQLFSPFSNYPIAFNNIAVVDPFYTFPFIICVVVIMFFNRVNKKRRLWLKLGLTISSSYMLFTIGNKLYIDSVYRKSLEESNIEAFRFSAQPALLTNVLWYSIAETKDAYYVADYSWFDSKNRFVNFNKIPKQRNVSLSKYEGLKRLSKFSNGYFNVKAIGENEFLYQDLRYPLLDLKDPSTIVFQFELYKTEKRLDMKPMKIESSKFNRAMSAIWNRIKGI